MVCLCWGRGGWLRACWRGWWGSTGLTGSMHACCLVCLRHAYIDDHDHDDNARSRESRIQPIVLVSIFMRLIVSATAKQFAGLFSSTVDTDDWDQDLRPDANVGAAAEGGAHPARRRSSLSRSFSAVIPNVEFCTSMRIMCYRSATDASSLSVLSFPSGPVCTAGQHDATRERLAVTSTSPIRVVLGCLIRCHGRSSLSCFVPFKR